MKKFLNPDTKRDICLIAAEIDNTARLLDLLINRKTPPSSDDWMQVIRRLEIIEDKVIGLI